MLVQLTFFDLEILHLGIEVVHHFLLLFIHKFYKYAFHDWNVATYCLFPKALHFCSFSLKTACLTLRSSSRS